MPESPPPDDLNAEITQLEVELERVLALRALARFDLYVGKELGLDGESRAGR